MPPSGEQVNKSLDNLVTSVATSAASLVTSFIPAPIANIGNAIAGFFGFDRPMTLTVPTRTTNVVGTDACANYGLDQSILVAAGPPTNAVMLPTGVGDDMALAMLASTPMLLGVNVLTTATLTPGYDIWRIPVNPKFLRPVGTKTTSPATYVLPVYDPTFLAMAAIPFSYWRGTMRYRVCVFTSTFLTMRLVIRFDPMNASVPALTTDYKDSLHRIVDVAGDTVIDFEVPFTFQRAWASQSIGSLALEVLTAPTVVTGQTATNVTFATYVAGGVDMEFRELSTMTLVTCESMGLPDSVNDPDPGPEPPVEVEAHSDPRADFMKPFTPLAGKPIVVSVPDTYFHDVYTHLGDLLRKPQRINTSVNGLVPFANSIVFNLTPSLRSRYTLSAPVTASLTAYTVDSSGSWPAVTVKTTDLGAAYTLSSRCYSDPTVTTVMGVLPTLFDHFSSCYKYSTGGMRIKLWVANFGNDCMLTSLPTTTVARMFGVSTMPSTISYTNSVICMVSVDNTTNACSIPSFDLAPLTVPAFARINSYFEAELPSNMNVLWRTTGEPVAVASGTGDYPFVPLGDVWARYAPVVPASPNPLGGAAAIGGINVVAVCGADDFRFGYRKGPRRAALFYGAAAFLGSWITTTDSCQLF